jgi:flagellum-specific ATP synthase
MDASVCRDSLAPACGFTLHGRVEAVGPLWVDIAGLAQHLAIGDRVRLVARDGTICPAEIIGAHGTRLRAAAFGVTTGLGAGAAVLAGPEVAGQGLAPCLGWLGRVVDPLGNAADGKAKLPRGGQVVPARRAPPPAVLRARLGPPIDLGVRVLNLFTPCRMGQRLGLFAGSGIGKSTLLGMLARHAACDVIVLALVGERGREVRDFIEDELGPSGLARAVVVVATSDAPPAMKREAAYAATAIAEYFRDQGLSVLLLMDSVTRFCLALREIGLANGEPPATRGYPPSVFAELPALLERAGPGLARPHGEAGQITAVFTVLVEGGDHDEPVADAVRGILDGHIVLERRIGEAGRYPAVDIARSLSRTAASCLDAGQKRLVSEARAMLALHAEMADMVRLGAVRPGADPVLDRALRVVPRIEAMLCQGAQDPPSAPTESFAALESTLA